MPLLSILILIVAIQSVPWPEPMLGGVIGSIIGTITTHALVVAFGWRVNQRLASALRNPKYSRSRVIQRYVRCRYYLYFLNIAALLLSLGVFGWGSTVRQHGLTLTVGSSPAILFPLFELVVILPTIVTTILGWLGHHAVERAMRETAAEPPSTPFFGRTMYVLFQLRMYAMLVLLPVVLTAVQLSFNRMFPAIADHPITLFAGTVGALGFFVIFPLVVPMLLGLVPMKQDSVRQRFEAFAKRCGLRSRDTLVWPTRGSMANAFVIGVIPQARYVIFSDKLLDILDPDERDAVYGHEIGHVHHGHIPYYAVFLILSGSVMTLSTLAICSLLGLLGYNVSEENMPWLIPVPVVALGVYLFLAFGYLSRRCERQADIFGCKSVSCGNPNCDGHDESTVYPSEVTSLCPTGIRTFVNALDRVIGGESSRDQSFAERWVERIRAWQHGPTRERMDYLLSLIEHPEREPIFQRRFFLTKVVILVVLAIVTTVLAFDMR